MNELMLFGTLSAQRTEAALLCGNAVTERFALTLTPEQCGRLLERRASALRETERIEPGEGIRVARADGTPMDVRGRSGFDHFS